MLATIGLSSVMTLLLVLALLCGLVGTAGLMRELAEDLGSGAR